MARFNFYWKQFLFVVLLTSIWINVSEVFRYFVLVIPRVKSFWNDLETVADMNWLIFSIWGIWDTILTAFVVIIFWLYSRAFGDDLRSVVVSGSIAWGFFLLYWIGAANMGYSNWSILAVTLPLSWLEMVVACYISSKLYLKLNG
ncbi:MAG: hypothetical protein AAFN93_28145 [Bacteroidota bacterium]